MDIISAGASLIVGQKLLGKTFEVVSTDIAKIYEKGRDKIIESANRKIENIDDRKTANLRVARDVFMNGSFSDDAISAEYFGGILASARTEDGKDDSGIYYTDIIKSLSSQQLRLHYFLYSNLNKYLLRNEKYSSLNPGMESELTKIHIYLSYQEIMTMFQLKDIVRDLHILASKDLIETFSVDKYEKDGSSMYYVEMSPKPQGIQLYAVVHNQLDSWLEFSRKVFVEFPDIDIPQLHSDSLDDLFDKSKNSL